MNQQQFEQTAIKLIEGIADKCEGFDLDYDIKNGVLYIENDSGTYVINKHSPMMQIWLSSPVSGAKHFNFNNNSWICTKTNIDLFLLLNNELFRE